MSRIFISYRRDDSAETVERLDAALTERYGRRFVFRDNRSIPAGATFSSQLELYLMYADVVLVVIGPTWLEATDAQGHRRLDDPADYVRREVGYALTARQLVVPVLLDGTRMPSADALPENLRALTMLQAVTIRSDALEQGARELIRGIDSHLRWRFPHPEGLLAAALLPTAGIAYVVDLAANGQPLTHDAAVQLYLVSLGIWFFGMETSIRKRHWEWALLHLVAAGLATGAFLLALSEGTLAGGIVAGFAGLVVALTLAVYGFVGPRRPGRVAIKDIMPASTATSSATRSDAGGASTQNRWQGRTARRVMLWMAGASIACVVVAALASITSDSAAAPQLLVGILLLILALIAGVLAHGIAAVTILRNVFGFFIEAARPGSDWIAITKRHNRMSVWNVVHLLALWLPLVLAFTLLAMFAGVLDFSSLPRLVLVLTGVIFAFPLGVLLFALLTRA